MTTIDHARMRLTAIIEEINRLQQSEFPYQHSLDALDLLEIKFKHDQSILEKTSPGAPSDVIKAICSVTLFDLFVFVPILGFILRSTNVRNGFEAYGPLLRLTRSILGNGTKLIVSSEWEFSPFVYRRMAQLEDFVLIGLPAPESANPLLIPLAGHELGHSVWGAEKFSNTFSARVNDSVIKELTENRWKEYKDLNPQYEKKDLQDLLAQPTWMPAYTWALLQAEEMFCDFVGMQFFAESYMHAFAYLGSPGLAGQRSARYPDIQRRVSHIVEASKVMGVTVPPEFESGYISQTAPVDSNTKLLVSIADTVSASLAPDLIKLAQDYAINKAVPVRDIDKVNMIYSTFRDRIAPTTEPQSLTDLLNAGWLCAQDTTLWEHVPQIKPEEKHRVIMDLILKSMEVSEIYERLREPL